ncbi:hypothetical protein ACJX0J_016310, partial [Zea mays]
GQEEKLTSLLQPQKKNMINVMRAVLDTPPQAVQDKIGSVLFGGTTYHMHLLLSKALKMQQDDKDRKIEFGAKILLEENASRLSCESEAFNMTIKAEAEKNSKDMSKEANLSAEDIPGAYDNLITFMFFQ